MVVSTGVGARASRRRGWSCSRASPTTGFVFFTNQASRKGVELAAEPRCALLFPWHPLERQVRVEGTATVLPDEEVTAYFASPAARVAPRCARLAPVAGRGLTRRARGGVRRGRGGLPGRGAGARGVGWLPGAPRGRGVLAGATRADARPARLPPHRSGPRGLAHRAPGPLRPDHVAARARLGAGGGGRSTSPRPPPATAAWCSWPARPASARPSSWTPSSRRPAPRSPWPSGRVTGPRPRLRSARCARCCRTCPPTSGPTGPTGTRSSPACPKRSATRSGPSSLVIEDAHWADDATLDLIRHLARRVHRLGALVLVTYRSEETTGSTRCGSCWATSRAPPGIRRIDLAPLTLDAVRRLVGTAGTVDAEELYRETGGNPFYVTEVIAAGGSAVPRSVHDAVLSRTARLTDRRARRSRRRRAGRAARRALPVAAVAPGSEAGLDEALGAGRAPAPGRRADVPPRARAALRGRGGAAAAADRPPPADPRGARRRTRGRPRSPRPPRRGGRARRRGRPARAGGRRPRRVARGAQGGRPAVRARAPPQRRTPPPSTAPGCSAALSYEQYVTGRIAEALAARREALAIWVERGRRRRDRRHPALVVAAELVRRRQRRRPRTTPSPPARRWPAEAHRDEAMALSNRAQLTMLAGDLEGTREWAGRALRLLDTLPAGSAGRGRAGARAQQPRHRRARERRRRDVGRPGCSQESLDRAVAADLHEHAARAFTNLGASAVRQHRHAEARRHLVGRPRLLPRAGPGRLGPLHARLARHQPARRRADLEEATAQAEQVLRNPRAAAVSRIGAALRARPGAGRGRDGGTGATPLAEARELADGHGRGPARLGRRRGGVRDRLDRRRRRGRGAHGDLGVGAGPAPTARAGPAAQVATWLPAGSRWRRWSRSRRRTSPRLGGDWAGGGADLGRARQSRSRSALALARGGTREGLADAALAFDDLGAEAAAARARAISRAHGWAPPRGRRADTRAHPDGLTRREAEVLELLREGLRRRRDRRAPGPLPAHRRAPRGLDPRQARRRLPSRRLTRDSP